MSHPPANQAGGSRRLRKASSGVIATLLLSFYNLANGQALATVELPQTPDAPPSHLLRELLEQDAKEALRIERMQALKRQGGGPSTVGEGPAAQPASAATPAMASGDAEGSTPPPVRLLAIHGVSGRLLVELEAAGLTSAYRIGHDIPVAGPDMGYRLRRVELPCAQFQAPDAREIRLCLNDEQKR